MFAKPLSPLHSLLPSLRTAAPLLIVCCTAVIFVLDLHFPMGFAPWLPYFVLAFATARLYEPRTLLLATAFWSLAIVGEPLLHSEEGDIFGEGIFNRTLGIVTLWILSGLLYADTLARRGRQASEARLQAIMQGALDAVVTMDRDGLVVQWNPQAETTFGFTREEAVGTPLAQLIIPPQLRETHAKGLQRFLSTGEERILRRRIEVTALRKNGQEFPVELTVLPLRVDGQMLFSSFIRDITEHKEADAAVLSARLAAEEASKAKSDFLANMSHEMRTPLNAVIGMTEILGQTPLSAEQRALVGRCAKAGDGLLRMIEELLLAAKTESGTLVLAADPFDLDAVVAETIELVSTDAHGKGLSLTLHMDDGLPVQVVGDAQRLQQVLLNLIRNAIKFTTAGSVVVSVAPLSQRDGLAEILFTVADTGAGIPADEQERIFDRFTQIHSHAARRQGGVGLGLSISKQLVELMGGRIRIESAVGRGSTFYFTVRLKTAHKAGSQSSPRLAGQVRLRPARTEGLDILLVDDCAESREVMRLYLRDSPHRLHCASSGGEAVTRFKAEHYDLVFMDLHMPGMDGYVAACLIRAWETEQGRPPVPIIALSANGLGEARQESQAAGCDDFLTKPAKMETVLQTVGRYAAGTAEPTPPAAATGAPPEMDDLEQLKVKFIRNRRREVAVLQAALADNEFDRMRTIGHRIKGLAGSYGLHEIGAIGAQLEQAALARNPEQVTGQVAELIRAVRDAEQACLHIITRCDDHAA